MEKIAHTHRQTQRLDSIMVRSEVHVDRRFG